MYTITPSGLSVYSLRLHLPLLNTGSTAASPAMIPLLPVVQLAWVILTLTSVTSAATPCDVDLPNVFANEKGSFEFQWEVNATSLTIQFQLPGSAYVGIGLGGVGGMADVDMVRILLFYVYTFNRPSHKPPLLFKSCTNNNKIYLRQNLFIYFYVCQYIHLHTIYMQTQRV